MTPATQTATRPLVAPILLSHGPRTTEANDWPRDIAEAYARHPGPYSLDDVAAILEEQPVELLNGWLVRQEVTNLHERRIVSNLQSAIDLAAREAGFGQVLGDQTERFAALSHAQLLRLQSMIESSPNCAAWLALAADA